MLHTLCFSLQNAVYFILLHFLVHVLFTFYVQGVLKFKLKLWWLKVNVSDSLYWGSETLWHLGATLFFQLLNMATCFFLRLC
jgi:hypothetical protein